MYEDKTLICKECGKEFVFTAGEQEFYASKGFENEPQRCKACRQNRKNAAKPEREMYTAVCAACGKEALNKGAHAGNLVREVAKAAGGNGGGKPDLAMAGGKDISAANKALSAAEQIIAAQIGV